MHYSIIKVVNGTFTIHAEGTNVQSIKVTFFGTCQTLWNASDVITGKLQIVDENLNPIEGGRYTEYITHPAT